MSVDIRILRLKTNPPAENLMLTRKSHHIMLRPVETIADSLYAV
jgi:hypothetical protein